MLDLGTRVRHSDYALQPARDYWQGCGREPQKSRARDAYEARRAERGTIIEVFAEAQLNGRGRGYRVQWDSGAVSQCLCDMVDALRKPYVIQWKGQTYRCMTCRADMKGKRAAVAHECPPEVQS